MRPDVLFYGSLSVGAFAASILLAYETWAISSGNRTLTMWGRAAIHDWPPIAFAIAFALGWLINHFFWPKD